MSRLTRVVLVRHGETVGESSIRFHGATDVDLSELGCTQALEARRHIPGVGFDLVVASPLLRAWRTATLLAPDHPVRLEADFREIDFGRWEGLSKDEIAAVDPILYEDWQAKRPGFDFPEGERRADFQSRVERGLARIHASGLESVIVVAHKGVVRGIVQALSGVELPPLEPALGGVIQVFHRSDSHWHVGRRST
jgi:broad specificity phosphatase PhoE